MRLSKKILLFILLGSLTNCQTLKVWSVKSSDKGGVLGVSGYSEANKKEFYTKVKNSVSCPQNYVLHLNSVASKSTSKTNYMILRKPDEVTTINSSYTARDNYFNQASVDGNATITKSGGYNFVPYQSTTSWSEVPYSCLDEKECLSGDMGTCLLLAVKAKERQDFPKYYYLMDKICRNGKDETSPLACLSLAEKKRSEGNLKETITYLKKSCFNDRFNSDIKNLSCAFLAAYTGNKSLMKKNISKIEETCMVSNDHETCYNLACIHSLSGNTNSALLSLARAIKYGYKDWNHLLNDPDLKAVRQTEEFKRYKSQNQQLRNISSK